MAEHPRVKHVGWVRKHTGQRICLIAFWLWEHGCDGRLYPIHNGLRKLGMAIQGIPKQYWWPGHYDERR